MEIIPYADLDTSKVSRQFTKMCDAIARDDWNSAELKKLASRGIYRVRLDHTNRLLLKFVRYQNRTVCLALEVVHQHAYDKARFLRGAAIDEAKIDDAVAKPSEVVTEEVRYLHPGRTEFRLQERVLSFDDTQQQIFTTPAPLILVGSAGSGKTAIVLEKLRQAAGRLLFVTQSTYLAQAARDLYFAHGYENEAQEIEFLSFHHFLESLRVPPGREVNFEMFSAWARQQPSLRSVGDAHQVYEEIRGVLASAPEGPLSREQYLALGIKQSIFTHHQRVVVYDIFEKYKAWLTQSQLYDTHLISHQWIPQTTPTYDFIAVDEVQDLTPVQLKLILLTLRQPGQFLLCGDSNQIVHPNLFSWSRVKSLFWENPELAEKQRLALLAVNFRNSQEVTRMANHLLKIKHARFGSIDRESNFLVRSTFDANPGTVALFEDNSSAKAILNKRSRRSTRYAVIVLRDADKATARKFFQTPLVFSVHEVKGLEYEHIILFNLVSSHRHEYAEVCAGVTAADLTNETLVYRRGRDKTDKSLEIYKFYVNALYVALTRAMQHIAWVEADAKHPLLRLLNVHEAEKQANDTAVPESSRAEWEREATRLAQQGKREQADAIRAEILHERAVPWQPWTRRWAHDTTQKAVGPGSAGAKVLQQLYAYALLHGDAGLMRSLAAQCSHSGARQILAQGGRWANDQHVQLRDKTFAGYIRSNFKTVLSECEQYGVDMVTQQDATPLMLAAWVGNVPLVEALIERGADTGVVDDYGHTAVMFALRRAQRDAPFAAGPFGALWDLLHPRQIDVQTDGRLIRLMPQQAEYFLLTTMLAGLKDLTSFLLDQGAFNKRAVGFYVDYLMRNIDHLPQNVYPLARRKRSYLNHVMARAEIGSSYQPARKLWRRVRTGFYMPNQDMLLRLHRPGQQPTWQPLKTSMPRIDSQAAPHEINKQ